MIEKLTVEQFEQIRSQLSDLSTYYEENKYDENWNINEEVERKFLEQWLILQEQLLSYDLSDIPFEEWQGMEILSDEDYPVDFSKTKANIDFKFVRCWGNANFKGCNVRNLGEYERYLNPKDFDEQTIRNNSSLFLSDAFSDKFKEKYYGNKLTMNDIVSLPSNQIEELKQKNYALRFDFYDTGMNSIIGLDKMIELYNHSQEEYQAVKDTVRKFHDFEYIYKGDSEYSIDVDKFKEQMRNADIHDMKNICYTYIRSNLLTSKNVFLMPDKLPELFVRENSDILLTDPFVPKDLRERYWTRKLTLDDVINNIDLFDNIPIEYWMDDSIDISSLTKGLGYGNFQKVLKQHPDVIRHIINSGYFAIDNFSSYLKKDTDLEWNFNQAVKKFFLSNMRLEIDAPDWISSMNWSFVNEIKTSEDLIKVNSSNIVLDYKQQRVIDILNIENIKRFEQETGFFSHKFYDSSGDFEMFEVLANYFDGFHIREQGFKNGTLSYDEFIDEFARCLDNMRIIGVFNQRPDYDWMQGEFRDKHPEIFMDTKELKYAFYTNRLNFDFLFNHREYIPYLLNRNLSNVITENIKLNVLRKSADGTELVESLDFIDEYLSRYGNEKLLQLVSKYGRVLSNVEIISFNDEIENEQSIEKALRSAIYNKIKKETIDYSYLSGVLDFVSEYPEIFLDDNAPEPLKHCFYGKCSFSNLQQHKEWLPYLKDKAIYIALSKNSSFRDEMEKFFEVFGEEKAIKLGINRTETVEEMMKAHQVDLMKSWYDKTGGKFIPDFVIMQNFSLEEADKFLASGANWSNLMRIKNFARTPESRDAMLKLAYSFGAFDQDQRGFKKLQDLLTGLPRKIDESCGYIFDRIDDQINCYSQRGVFFHNRAIIDVDGNRRYESPNMTLEEKEEAYQEMINYVKNNNFIDLLNTDTLVNLLESLKKENVDIDFTKDIFSQIYRKNEDGSYTLTINQQSCPKSSQAIRCILEKFVEIPMLTPDKAHKLVGGFKLKYDADFREFLLANMDEILKKPEYVSLVSSIQKQFSEIKAVNSNRALTWELAVSYIQVNKFSNVNTGNESVAEISAIAGYSQADFDTLQQIYNYGKQRTFSSIPRIEKTSGKYTYEILRLDDPLAMAIGTLTDCCQELGNCAEVCMEHSMVDKNGRVFVIKDEVGNIVAQSWVWRNKDILCFDNIEIPDKAFARAIKESPKLGRKGFTDEVYGIYKQAAHDLIEKDEQVYKELFEIGKITQEQYDGLRLGKVTVGLGYNDIAASLKQNSSVDKGDRARPLPFTEPVKLSRGLYTSDSTTQYVLEERKDRRKFVGDTLPVHSDTYIEYNDSNFNEKSLLSLEKLEIFTKEDPIYLDTSVDNTADKEHLVSEISRNYGLNPETARIIMHPNFAIIFDINDDKLRVGDLLFNTRVDNELQQMDIENQVVMQMRLAFEQIGSNKEIDISSLNDKQKEMYAKVTGLTGEIDIERGVGHAR